MAAPAGGESARRALPLLQRLVWGAVAVGARGRGSRRPMQAGFGDLLQRPEAPAVSHQTRGRADDYLSCEEEMLVSDLLPSASPVRPGLSQLRDPGPLSRSPVEAGSPGSRRPAGGQHFPFHAGSGFLQVALTWQQGGRGMATAAAAALELDTAEVAPQGGEVGGMLPLENPSVPNLRARSEPSYIGYRVVARAGGGGSPITIARKQVFAVVQVGSHQFKVTPGDEIYVEKLLYTDVNDEVALERVLLLGSASRTVIGRPVVPGASVLALVEEHALDAKIIVFKKKRRKNYRRTQGHRQDLTRLRIMEIRGIAEDGAPAAAEAGAAQPGTPPGGAPFPGVTEEAPRHTSTF